MSGIIETHRAGLVAIVSDLGEVAMSASDPIDPETSARLLAVANDLRGVAVPLGMPLVGEIANVMCDVVQRFCVGSTGAAALVKMLFHTLRKAYDAVGRGDQLQHETEIRLLLKELRVKIAAGV
jgi:hypothetical protein